MEIEDSEVDDCLQEEQTDVESLAGTLITFSNSSVTQLPNSGSETEYEGDDDLVGELLETQFSSLKEENVQEWLNTTNEETLHVLGMESQRDQLLNHSADESEVEKIAAVFLDALLNGSFDANAWAEAEIEQQVPSGNFKANLIKETRERPILTLMNFIKIYCNDSVTKSEHLCYKIVEYAVLQQMQKASTETASIKERNSVDFGTLENFRGYFWPLRIRVFKCPKNKRVFVKAVEKFVSEEITNAAKGKNAVLFTRYAKIPEVVRKCNDDYGLNFSPEQLARYGIYLQKAVHQEMVARCLDFLNYIGFTLASVEEDKEEDKLNLCSYDSALSQGFSSQGSQHEMDSCASQNSDFIEPNQEHIPYAQGNDSLASAEANFAALNSPPSIEILREHRASQNSPGASQNSQRSWNSYENPSPRFSIPELEPEGTTEPLIEQDEAIDTFAVELEQYMIRGDEGWFGGSHVSDGSQNSYQDGEPRRRRRRLE